MFILQIFIFSPLWLIETNYHGVRHPPGAASLALSIPSISCGEHGAASTKTCPQSRLKASSYSQSFSAAVGGSWLSSGEFWGAPWGNLMWVRRVLGWLTETTTAPLCPWLCTGACSRTMVLCWELGAVHLPPPHPPNAVRGAMLVMSLCEGPGVSIPVCSVPAGTDTA